MASTASTSTGECPELDQLALGAVLAFKQRGHQLRLQFVSAGVLFPGFGDGRDFAVFKRDDGAVGRVERFRSGSYLDGMRREPKVADRRIAVLAVLRSIRPGAIERQFRQASALSPTATVCGTSVDLGRVAEDRSGHAAVHDPLVLDVEVGEHRQKDDASDHESRGEQLHQRIAEREVVHLRGLARGGATPGLGARLGPQAELSGSLSLIATFVNTQRCRSL